MSFTVKNWIDYATTALDSVALEDMETRLSNYSDEVSRGAFGGMVMPIMSMGLLPTVLSTALTQYRVYLVAVQVPRTGTLSGVAAWVGAQAGNLEVGVYDDGSTTAGSITLLSDSGSIACPAAGAWRDLYNPNIAVTAGQRLYFALQSDSTTVTVGRLIFTNSPPGYILPSGYFDSPGGINKLLGYNAAVSFGLPASITDANITHPGTTAMAFLIGKIT